ncbi:MAG TPA: SIMPL domain-containing protein [Tepidisphaeraceae bacterium]|jgi:uncharacterized protein YggE|nr:SIMPL domain-containing protein [Tepidisphaeraceae bacterium]
MNRKLLCRAFGALVLLMGICTVAKAAATEGAVSGTGHVTITRPPQILRVQLGITADGKDINEAIANLKKAQADATKKLTDLAATAKSIEFGPMTTGGATDPRQQYIQQMLGRQGRKKPTTGTPSVSISCTVKAEWPVKEGPQEQQLAEGYALQEKVKAAGLGKSNKTLSPEEQEVAEEAAAMNNGAANPNDPTFLYVAKVSDEDRAAAMADAFKKAKAQATLLAKAADAQLGALQKVSGSASAQPASAENYQEVYMRLMMQQAGAAAPAEDAAQDEATGTSPGPVALQVTVTATFDLAK